MTWRESAACRGSDLNWFPAQNDRVGNTACLAVCRSCTVSRACLRDALATGDEYGVRGGRTEQQRLGIRTARPVGPPPIRRHGTESGYAAHRRRGEDACAECKAGHNIYRALRRPGLRVLADRLPEVERYPLAGMSAAELDVLEERERSASGSPHASRDEVGA